MSAALFQQALDFDQVGVEAGELFGHIDADREGGGFGQGAVARHVAGDGVAGGAGRGVQGFVPAVDEALALLLDQLGNQGLGVFGQGAQLFEVVQQHGGQALAFAFAGAQQLVQPGFGQGDQGVVPFARAGSEDGW